MIFENSRYATGLNLYLDKENDITYMDFPDTYIPSKQEDYVYRFKSGDELGIISKDFYGDVGLKWLILYANPQFYSELEIKAGDVLVLPHPDRVSKYVNGNQ